MLTLFSLSGAAWSAPVYAEPSGADRTLAAALFREGKALMDKGDYPAACGKLEESQRLDPGGGTILNLALCHEKQGRPATAWAEFIEALGIARRDHRQARIDLAEEHIAKLEPALSKMTIVVPPESDEPTLEVTRDGAAVGRAAWGMPFPVDPGEHRVQAAASGKTAFRSTVTVGTGAAPASLTVRIPPLERAPAEGAAAEGTVVASQAGAPTAAAAAPVAGAKAGSAAAPHDASAPGREAAPASHSSAQSIWGWGAIGLGGAGVITGAILTGIAVSKKNQSEDRCPHDPCDAQAVSLSEDAGRFADFATVSYGVGLAALAAGVILLVTDGPAPASSGKAPGGSWAVYPAARSGEATVAVRGQF
jgi:hypothetical protein